MYQIPLYFQKVLSPFTDILYGVENSDKAILKTIENIMVIVLKSLRYLSDGFYTHCAVNDLLTATCTVYGRLLPPGKEVA